MSVLYSFIVPHHNNPILLKRLVDSIPQRSDVEVIIVDDNSDEDKKNIYVREDCRIFWISSAETKGAGKARNLGLDHAKGKWLLFADCDDFYESGFLSVLDQYSDLNIDILFYDVYYTWDEKNKCERWKQLYSTSIRNYAKNKSEYWSLMVKHVIQGPWNFMVKREYVQKIQARFEEVPKGNDAYFHHLVAMSTNNFAVTEKKIYYWIFCENGLTQKRKSKEAYLSEISHNVKLLKMRASARAWNTIPPFYKGFGKIRSDCGLLFSIKWLWLSFFSDFPWIKAFIMRKIMEKKKHID